MTTPLGGGGTAANKNSISEKQQKSQLDFHKVVRPTFPFDLNSLMNITYSFDTLKQAIDYLAKNSWEQGLSVEKFKEYIFTNIIS